MPTAAEITELIRERRRQRPIDALDPSAARRIDIPRVVRGDRLTAKMLNAAIPSEDDWPAAIPSHRDRRHGQVLWTGDDVLRAPQIASREFRSGGRLRDVHLVRVRDEQIRRRPYGARVDDTSDGQVIHRPRSLLIESSGPQDDDLRVRVGGVVAVDTRWNVGWYNASTYVGPSGNPSWATSGFRRIELSAGEIDALGVCLRPGVTVEIDVFDGWGTGWQSSPWVATVDWTDGRVQTFEGGAAATGASQCPTYQQLGITSAQYYAGGPWGEFYIPNGSFVV